MGALALARAPEQAGVRVCPVHEPACAFEAGALLHELFEHGLLDGAAMDKLAQFMGGEREAPLLEKGHGVEDPLLLDGCGARIGLDGVDVVDRIHGGPNAWKVFESSGSPRPSANRAAKSTLLPARVVPVVETSPRKLLTFHVPIGLVRLEPILIGAALLVAGLAGCIGADDSLDPADADETDAQQDYVAVDEASLSQPVFEIEPRVTDRVTVTVDDVEIFVEYWLPDGEGPFPTIVHSTPYSHLDRPMQELNAGGDETFYVPRGYAYMVADVRGFGESQGCVEVWGENEQADQADLIDWITDQEWSDGTVGMIGASYPGTTPMEAAVQAPEGLEAIVAVAGLTDPYYDWHYGGVPNGESGPAGSPAAYQGIGAVVPMEAEHGPAWAQSLADTGCQTPQLVLDAYQSDGTYSEFYEERNLTQRVDQVEAAVLYTQGFADLNVKPSQVLNWFNDLDTDKKGLFGPWGHQYPPRDDWTNMTLAWFDEHLKGQDTRVMEGPTVEVHNNLDTWRADVAFPTHRANDTPLFLTPSEELSFQPADEGEIPFELDRLQSTADFLVGVQQVDLTEPLVLDSGPLEEDVYLSGVPRLNMDISIEGSQNAFLSAELVAVDGDGEEQVTYGQQNLALRNDVTSYEPMPEGEIVDASVRFQPVEYILEAGTSLQLVLEPIDHNESPTIEASQPSTVTLHTGGDSGTHLSLPLLEDRPDEERPEDV